MNEQNNNKPPKKEKKPFYKRWWIWAIAVFIIFVIAIPKEPTEPTEAVTTPPAETQTAESPSATIPIAESEPPTEQQETPPSESEPPAEIVDIDAVRALYSQLVDTYASQKEAFDAPAWAEYMRGFNDTCDSYKATNDVAVKLAVADLRQLASEYGSDLQGRGDDKAIATFEGYMAGHFAE